MSYSNCFSLSLIDLPDDLKLKDCCDTASKHESNNFCPKCGTEINRANHPNNIITQFVSSYDEAKYLLTLLGRTNNPGTGYDISKNLIEFSKNYPTVTFVLKCIVDPGLVSDNNTIEYSFVKNGKSKKGIIRTIVTNPFTELEYIA